MRQLKKLDIHKSILHKKLIYEEGFFDTSDSIFFYLINFITIVGSILIWKVHFNPNDKFIIYITPFLIFYCLYSIYRKATEKKISILETPFDKERNKQILFEFGKKRRYDIYRDTKDCLILNEPNNYFNSTYIVNL